MIPGEPCSIHSDGCMDTEQPVHQVIHSLERSTSYHGGLLQIYICNGRVHVATSASGRTRGADAYERNCQTPRTASSDSPGRATGLTVGPPPSPATKSPPTQPREASLYSAQSARKGNHASDLPKRQNNLHIGLPPASLLQPICRCCLPSLTGSDRVPLGSNESSTEGHRTTRTTPTLPMLLSADIDRLR